MSGVRPYLCEGPETYEVSAAVTGGQGVEPDTSAGNAGKVKPWAAGTVKGLGVAETDAQPSTNTFGSGSTGYGSAFVDVSVPSNETAVRGDGVYYMTYAAAANFGDLLIAAANGQVTTYTNATTSTYDKVIGRCVEPLGVGVGASGRVRLLLA